jgi:hypothetical protein
MAHLLINPNQFRAFGVDLCDDPFDPHRPLRFIEPDSGVTVPFQTAGTNIFFETRCPTQEELDTCQHLILSSDNPWNPSTLELSLHSKSIEEEERSRIISEFTNIDSDDFEVTPTFLTDCSSSLCPRESVTQMILMVQVASGSRRNISSVTSGKVPTDVPSPFIFESSKRHSSVSPEDIIQHWGIGLVAAKQTANVTTQRGIRSAILPLRRRYCTYRFSQPRRLKGDMYIDTAIAKVKSLNGNKYAQVFANTNNFVAVYPMRSKTMAGDALAEFTQDFGIPT